MINIYVIQQILAPVEQINQLLLDHQQLNRFFNAKISLITPENQGELLGGKGAIRRVEIGKVIFLEEIIKATTGHICYRIIGKSPVSEHQGDIKLTAIAADNQSTQLDYSIKFKGPKWIPSFVLKYFVGRDIEHAMKKLAEHFHLKHAHIVNSSKGKSV